VDAHDVEAKQVVALGVDRTQSPGVGFGVLLCCDEVDQVALLALQQEEEDTLRELRVDVGAPADAPEDLVGVPRRRAVGKPRVDAGRRVLPDVLADAPETPAGAGEQGSLADVSRGARRATRSWCSSAARARGFSRREAGEAGELSGELCGGMFRGSRCGFGSVFGLNRGIGRPSLRLFRPTSARC
jgi:hypothetical protein